MSCTPSSQARPPFYHEPQWPRPGVNYAYAHATRLSSSVVLQPSPSTSYTCNVLYSRRDMEIPSRPGGHVGTWQAVPEDPTEKGMKSSQRAHSRASETRFPSSPTPSSSKSPRSSYAPHYSQPLLTSSASVPEPSGTYAPPTPLTSPLPPSSLPPDDGYYSSHNGALHPQTTKAPVDSIPSDVHSVSNSRWSIPTPGAPRMYTIPLPKVSEHVRTNDVVPTKYYFSQRRSSKEPRR